VIGAGDPLYTRGRACEHLDGQTLFDSGDEEKCPREGLGWEL
jgi:hypothetical protein